MALGLAGSNGMSNGIIIGADSDSETFLRPTSIMTYFLDACEALKAQLNLGLSYYKPL